MNGEHRQESAPNPSKLDYAKVVDAIEFLIASGFSETKNLHQVRREILFSLHHANANIQEADDLLDALNAIDSLLKEIENPS